MYGGCMCGQVGRKDIREEVRCLMIENGMLGIEGNFFYRGVLRQLCERIHSSTPLLDESVGLCP